MLIRELYEGKSENESSSISGIVDAFVNDPIGKKYANYDCKTVTRAFVKWAEANNIPTQVLSLAPPSAETIKQRPNLRGKSGEGDGHIMPVVNGQAIDFTVRQFGVNRSYENPLITPISQVKQVYNKIGGYFTDAPEWFLGGKTHYLGPWSAMPSSIMNMDFGDEVLGEGPTWDRIKKTAATGALAAGLGMGGAHLATKAPSNTSPVEKPAATMQAEPSQPLAVTVSKEVPKDEPKVDEKPIPSTVNAADPEIEKIVFSAAWRSGLRGNELAQFMAQTAHETLGFQRMVEQGDNEYFKKYDPKYNPQKAKILGNVKPGDGARYKGRGFIQITGRYNYKQAGKALGLPLEQKPELAEKPEVAVKIAIWYWKNRVQNAVDDYSDTIGVTSRINPSMSGLGDRDLNFQKYIERLKPIMNRG